MKDLSMHRCSAEDRAFLRDFQACRVAPAAFDHRAHLRLAYGYLTQHPPEEAHRRVRAALQAFIRHHGVPPSKYHETLTRAWVLAVAHFMQRTPPAPSAEVFLARNPVLLRSEIMLTHYSRERLFSEQARAAYVEPDLTPIPVAS